MVVLKSIAAMLADGSQNRACSRDIQSATVHPLDVSLVSQTFGLAISIPVHFLAHKQSNIICMCRHGILYCCTCRCDSYSKWVCKDTRVCALIFDSRQARYVRYFMHKDSMAGQQHGF